MRDAYTVAKHRGCDLNTVFLTDNIDWGWELIKNPQVRSLHWKTWEHKKEQLIALGLRRNNQSVEVGGNSSSFGNG